MSERSRPRCATTEDDRLHDFSPNTSLFSLRVDTDRALVWKPYPLSRWRRLTVSTLQARLRAFTCSEEYIVFEREIQKATPYLPTAKAGGASRRSLGE